MEFLICPVPDSSVSKLEPGSLFRSPAGVPFYYAVDFKGSSISISDTAYRYVEFPTAALDVLIYKLEDHINIGTKTLVLFSKGDEVPMDKEELVSLLFILKRISKYTKEEKIIQYLQDPQIAAAYLYATLTAGAES